MKMILSPLLITGMMISGLAMAAQPQSSDAHKQASAPAPVVAGTSNATTASTGGLSTAQVVAVSIAVVATAAVVAGVARDDSHSGTTGTH